MMNREKKRILLLVSMVIFFAVCSIHVLAQTCLENLTEAIREPEGVLWFTFDSTVSTLPREISALYNLEDVRFEHAAIKSLPDEFYKLPSLKRVVFVSTNQLDIVEVIKKFAQCSTLESLGFMGMGLSSLPEEIGSLQQLIFLGVWDNSLHTVPESIGGLTNLEGLSLSGNRIDSFPTSIRRLLKLRYILLDDNELQNLPIGFTNISSLEGISLAYNPRLDIPTVLEQLRRYPLIELSLDSCNIVSLPPEIGQMQHLQYLYLRGNLLTELPKEITRLKELVNLDLYDNRIEYLPEDMGDLPSLRYLELSFNNIQKLPISLDSLGSKMIDIDVRENRLSDEEKARLQKVFKKISL